MPNPRIDARDRQLTLTLEIIHALVCMPIDVPRRGPSSELEMERVRLMVVPMRESA